MVWLVLGVLLWSAVHSIPSVGRPLRERLIERIGEGPYKGVFALGILSAIVLMVVGWRSTVPQAVYTPAPWAYSATAVLMLLAFVLFGAGHAKSNLRRVLRHPQLSSVVVWGIAHLLANGDTRSLVLFGGLAVWALVEMPLINRREGAWQRPARRPLSAEVKPLLIGAIVYGVFIFLHPYLFGVSPIVR